MTVIKIPKGKPLDLSLKKKRKAGTRAGLTKLSIAAAAGALIEKIGANEFSLRKLAKALGVVPTTIHAHFKGGEGAVLTAVAASAIAKVARPFKPKDDPADYLRELFFNVLKALKGRPTIAKLVVIQLSSNPILDPLLAERLLLALAELGVAKEVRVKMLHRALGALLEMIMLESCRSDVATQKEMSAATIKTIAALSPTEFSNLTELRDDLAAEAITAGASQPSLEAAGYYVDRLINSLELGEPSGDGKATDGALTQ
jgi:TetR/AcrR family transcriptional regulator, tetracycline repressor protein